MTLTERTEIEALALELGFVIRKTQRITQFTYMPSELGVSWSDEGSAASGTYFVDGDLRAVHTDYRDRGESIGSWVRMMLHGITSGSTARAAG